MVRTRDSFEQIAAIKKEESQQFKATMERRLVQAQREKRLRDEDERFVRDLLRDAGIDVVRIEEHERERAEEARTFVDRLRSQLTESAETITDYHGRRNVAFELGGSGPGSHVLPPYIASVGASNDLMLEGLDGTEDDDGSFTPNGPDVLNLVATDSDDGIFGFGGKVIPLVQADVYYPFVPDATGTHQITASLDFHGFYFVTADDKWWNSKSAEVRLSVEVSAKQYGSWQSSTTWTFIHERKTNGTRDGRIDKTIPFASKADLSKDDPVAVLVRVNLSAIAHGSGSFAEIDFSSGSANYIGLLPMTAEHL